MVGGFDWPGFLVKLVDRTRNIRNQPRCEMYNIYAGVESVRGREGGKQENNAKRGAEKRTKDGVLLCPRPRDRRVKECDNGDNQSRQ